MNDEGIELLTQKVIACAIEVHKQMGPGLNEGIYHDCFALELGLSAIPYESDVPILLDYKGQRLRKHFEIDLIVDGRLVVELKAVETLHPAHQAQVLTYLRITNLPAGLLLNFNQPTLHAGLKRLVHPALYGRKK